MGFINVSAYQISNDDHSATYKCTVSVATNSYYGMNIESRPIGVFDQNGCRDYIGWPKRWAWKAGWGTPDWRFDNEWVNSWWGNHPAKLLDDYKYEFTSTVQLNRGNSRKATTDIEVGVHSAFAELGIATDFNTCMKTVHLETTEIPKKTFKGSISCTIDSPQVRDRYIRLIANFDNPSSYYTAKIYDGNGKELAKSTGTSISLDIPITKEMYQTSVTYTFKLWGKDGTCYDTKTTGTKYIEPSGVGVTVKESGIHEVSTMKFRNVNIKEVKEVWIKKDGKVYQTRK